MQIELPLLAPIARALTAYLKSERPPCMGHDDILGTETYLTATPELLELAGNRLRNRYLKPPTGEDCES